MSMLFRDRADRISEVTLTDGKITLAQFVAVARFHAKVSLSPEYKCRVHAGEQRLKAILDSGKAVYGVNTGFGDNVRFRIGDDELSKLQENIVRSHGCSVGQPLTEEHVRAAMLMQLIKVGFGYSGVRLEIVLLIVQFLNLGLVPYVPSEGTIGGLSYPPYIAMTYMGEGRFWEDGKVVPAKEVFEKYGLTPIHYGPKEGFAMLTSTSLITTPGLLAIYDMVDTLRHALICASLTTEALRCTDKAFDDRLLSLKNHPEIPQTAAWMRASLAGSEIMEKARETRVQDATSIRMIPHLFGAVDRQTAETYAVMMEEFHSVTDNPVFLEDGLALMGANWESTHVGLYCDALAIGAATMGKEIETYMERLMDSHLSGLPHFLVKNPGLNNGFMIAQYVTAGLNGDLDRLACPGSTAHAFVSAGQEAPLSRADAASRKLCESARKLRSMVSMAILTALQAADFVDEQMSPVNSKACELVRRSVSFMENDDMMYERIEAMEAILDGGELLDLYCAEIGDFPI